MHVAPTAVRPTPARPSHRGLLCRAFAWLVVADARRRERRALADLDDRLLHDVGLTRALVAIELAKPSWRR